MATRMVESGCMVDLSHIGGYYGENGHTSISYKHADYFSIEDKEITNSRLAA